MRLGTTPEALLVTALVRSYPSVQEGMAAVGDEVLVSEWTIYRWLRGLHAPRARQAKKLRALAQLRQVEMEPPDASVAAVG